MAPRAFLRKSFLIFLVPLLVISPSLVWILLDTHPFGGDQSQYGMEAIALMRVLLHSPLDWGSAMVKAIGSKPPGLVWIAQFIVPVGHSVTAFDVSLLFVIIVTLFIVLGLVYRSLLELTHGSHSIALLGCLIVGAAPLFIYLSHTFMVEPLQTLSVAYFVFIMSFAPKWDRGLILSQLLVATSLALLAKASSPLYCFGPALLSLAYAFRMKRAHHSWRWLRPQTLITLTIGLLLGSATLVWYWKNIDAVLLVIRDASSGTMAKVWGKEDSFANTMVYWVGAVQHSFFLPAVAVFGSIIVMYGIICFLRNPECKSEYFAKCTFVAILQIIIILIIFSLNTARSIRYLLAALPYFALILCWSMAQIRKPMLTWLAIVIFVFQLLNLHAQAFGITALRSGYIGDVIDRSGHDYGLLDSIAVRTCEKKGEDLQLNILGIDPSLKGDWLTPDAMNYLMAKKRMLGHKGSSCRYDYLGGHFFGASASEAWNDMLIRKVKFFITTDPDTFPLRSDVYNHALAKTEFPFILEKARTSGIFEQQPPLDPDKGILIFRRVLEP